MSKKLLVLFAVAAFVCSFANVAFAINRVEVKVVSEPIVRGATCDKAGSFSLQWDASSILRHGDIITIDLDENVYLCRTIDILIAPEDDTILVYEDRGNGLMWYIDTTVATNPLGWRDTGGGVFNFPNEAAEPNAISPVSYYEDAAGPTAITESLVFRLTGTAGSDRVTLSIIGETDASQLTVGPDQLDAFTIRFFDQITNSTNPEGGKHFDAIYDGIYIDVVANVDGIHKVYESDATIADNTLCVDISSLPDTVSKVEANIDSALDKFTFIPSNPQIAHIRGAQNIVFDPCKNEICGRIVIGAQQDQGTSTCTSFDNESYAGYCPNSHLDNKKVIFSSTPFSNLVNLNDANLMVSVEIMVNGQTGDNGVYWAQGALATGGYDASHKTNCDYVTEGNPIANDIYYLGSGTSNLADATIMPAAVNIGCAIPSNNRVVKFTTAQSNLNLASGDVYLYLDLPSFNYDLNVIDAGDQVTVKITLTKYPCGELFSGETCIGTFGCDNPEVYTPVLFPYFAPANSNVFTNGMVITNLGSTAGNITLFWYEQDGDAFQIPITDYNGATELAANGIYLNTLGSIMESEPATRIAGTGEFGDSRCYVVACTNFTADGFALVFDPSNGVSTGYLPRVNFVNDAIDSVGQVITICNSLSQ